MKQIAEALAKFQAQVPKITRGKTVKVQSRSGANYTFDYAPHEFIIDTIKVDLAACNLSISQPLDTTAEGRLAVHTILLHASGECIEGYAPVPTHDGMSPQEIGSAITYMRRYALSAILGLATEEDDDANHASGNEAEVVRNRTGPAEGHSDGGGAHFAGERVGGASESSDDDPMTDAQRADVVKFANDQGTTWEEAVNGWSFGNRSADEPITVAEAREVCRYILDEKKVTA